MENRIRRLEAEVEELHRLVKMLLRKVVPNYTKGPDRQQSVSDATPIAANEWVEDYSGLSG